MKNQIQFLAIPAFLGIIAFCTPSQAQWQPAPSALKTQWAQQVSPQNALPEYPRPQMTRKNWQSLNGLWFYGLSAAASSAAPAAMSGKILVPFPYESSLSGIGKPSPVTQKVWYKRTFSVPAAWKGQKILLHFGAVNYDCSVRLNGKTLGSHQGGYDAFDFDISSSLKAGQNELVVSAKNPIATDVLDAQVVGKQRVTPGGIFYTGATGIWQSVWLEPVPKAYIKALKITPDVDASLLRLTVNSNGSLPVKVTALALGKVVATVQGKANAELRIPIKNAKLWSPNSPFLYNLKVDLGQGKPVDSVTSYAAMRKISLGKDAQNRTRIFLNNKFVFQVGALDQGYWPDGIYTAPTDAALKYDIQIAKNLGWNMLRKHAKVEPARWYYHADKMGMLVWQDMPQMFGGREGALSNRAKTQFDTEWREIMTENHNFPSIVVWTTFNEGMGQHDTERVVANTKAFDPSRLVNSASGWVDKNVGDMHDTHDYPGPGSKEPEAKRAAVNGEFGGITMNVPGHRWINNADVMGYGATLQSGWLATKRYQALLKNAYALKENRGTSAVVYTQLTDVEQEINGLLTYDRAVIKTDVKIVAAANKGQFLPLPPNPNPELVPTADEEPIDWQFTTEQPANNWFAPDFNDAAWKTGAAPFGHDIGNARTQWTSSDLWIRRQFTLPGVIPARLNLRVRHDDAAEIYVNGVLAATLPDYNNDYKEVPMSEAARATLQPGQNSFAVHVHQTVGGQGIDVGIVAAR
ncbi:Glycosyl hydrolases family 2, TIM barrel domain [Abditibacterium utsteinense]|uniref:Glycosyl hydrolases family 2, TIM barrel domain n=1 Tax=Abditibacterium utsteinense TaxID=1960156 RepID=A0A2S8SRV4_9BACT|nr:sugar-binding domain-containing protein [Abditibacterium utsteinense]PQV63506.1 Glycosyl hydrolases family 2, TIM barrel domain [Abditibacterium utsteinense]